MVFTLQKLPTELLHLTLQHLPLSDLLSFARTSKSNYNLSVQTLTSLDLAVFPRRIHSLLAFFDALNDEDEEDDEESEEDPPVSRYWARQQWSDKPSYQIGLTSPNNNRPLLSRTTTPPSLTIPSTRQRKTSSASSGQSSRSSSRPSHNSSPPTPLSIRTAEIASQNEIATQVLRTPSLCNLRTLSLRLYDLASNRLATTLASQFPILTSLSLEFSHPYIHDTTLPAKYWRDIVPPGSPIWNILSGVGHEATAALKLNALKSLRLTRSGITSFQLRSWIANNPELRELRLALCRGVDVEFVDWLADYLSSGAGQIQVLRFPDNALLELHDEEDFDWIFRLACDGTVKELSLRGCKSVNEDLFLQLAPTWLERGLEKVVSPAGIILRRKSVTGGQWFCRRTNVNGSASPALTVSDGDMSGVSFFADGNSKIEVDPDMVL